MKATSTQYLRRDSGRQSGFTLIEMSIAMAVALFLLAGLFSIVQGTRTTYGNQNSLAQLQDGERLAMTLVTDVVQASGYFPDPHTYTAAQFLQPITVGAASVAAGQTISGTYSTADPGDSLTVRYTTASGDNIINCVGGTNTTGAPASYVNTFQVVGGYLVCSPTNGGAVSQLVNGLTRMDVWYGVKRDFTVSDYSVDTYVRANAMTVADWSNISSVKVLLTFKNPLFGQPGQTSVASQTIQFTRIVAVMNRAGVKS
ncbi:MAG: putative type 4 fimbrial biosis transrane pilW-related protein precursor [Gammaproteobacteria bacterium]|nr:putative type 4 fimbrial biosis transrane pilW-related protein precursor [Gammaproteobacteria bacterium]MDB6107653.1 putative type 4 fimbrial biosis transrane pilW-related protein precursor [Gammaproteobacteria bacterium]